jgi:hypothetical protein
MKIDEREQTAVNESPTRAAADTSLTQARSRTVRALDGAMRKATGLERLRLQSLKTRLESGSSPHDINRLLKEAV